MKRLKFATILLLAILTINTFTPSAQMSNVARAQDDPWTATLWLADGLSAELLVYNSDGTTTTINVSSDLISEFEYFTAGIATSSDNRFIAHDIYETGTFRRILKFGQTGDGECCSRADDLDWDLIDFDLAGFEPDGGRFAFAYIRGADGVGESGGMMIVDAATGQILADMPMQDVWAAMGLTTRTDMWARMGDWTADGIQFAPNCYGCEGTTGGELSLWKPDDNTFVEHSGVYFSEFGARLEGTGEMVRRTQDTDFAFDPSGEMLPVPNVVKYYPDGDLQSDSTVIYHDADLLNVRFVDWVGDGQAILTISRRGDFWDIVHRDGSQARIEGIDAQFIGGTPSGWFAVGMLDDTPSLLHYDLATLEPTPIATVNISLVSADIVHITPLGASIDTPTFLALSPPLNGAAASCSGLLPSRLVVGGQGRVTPGQPNRLRENPSLNSDIIEQIPAEGIFTVLEGPYCDYENAIMWWRVNWEGLEGWTAEGQGDSYWTEPVE